MWHPNIPDEYKNAIVTGDCRELAKRIPDESVDLILTDPLYSQPEDYQWLAEAAQRVLKPGSAVLAWVNTRWLESAMIALRAGGCKYRYKFGCIQETGPAPMNGRAIAKENNLLWYDVANTSKMCGYLPDGYASRALGEEYASLQSSHFKWVKSPRFTAMAIEAFCHEGTVIWDPFSGGGTIPLVAKMTRRNFIASEIDPDTAERARLRLEQTQPPLPGLVYETPSFLEATQP